MKRKLIVNAGTALLLDEQSDALTAYGSITINGGRVVISRKVHEKMSAINASINSGGMSIIDIAGEVTELESGTAITAKSAFCGCYIICDGKLIIEDLEGLAGITGLYADRIFHPESVSLGAVKGITASRRIAYPDGAKLHLSGLTLGGETPAAQEGRLNWVNGNITALDGGELEKLREKEASFQCRKLIIRTSLFEKYADMFKAESITFVPDDHAYMKDLTLDAATQVLYGDKLFVNGDLMIDHDQAQHLGGLNSLIVEGTVTMPISAAASFKACGKARGYDLYEGVLKAINGADSIDHEQLKSAIDRGIRYTLRINGKLTFTSDVTAQDVEAIAAIECNGLLVAPSSARGALDSKIKSMNGKIKNLSEDEKDSTIDEDDSDVTKINTGTYRL